MKFNRLITVGVTLILSCVSAPLFASSAAPTVAELFASSSENTSVGPSSTQFGGATAGQVQYVAPGPDGFEMSRVEVYYYPGALNAGDEICLGQELLARMTSFSWGPPIYFPLNDYLHLNPMALYNFNPGVAENTHCIALNILNAQGGLLTLSTNPNFAPGFNVNCDSVNGCITSDPTAIVSLSPAIS